MIALWKDPSRGVREIPLEEGAHAVLLTVCMDRATRRSADGRIPVENGTACFDVAVHQVRASPPARAHRARPRASHPRMCSTGTTSACSRRGR